MKKSQNVLLTSVLISAALLFGMVSYLYGYQIQVAIGAAKGKSATATAYHITLALPSQV